MNISRKASVSLFISVVLLFSFTPNVARAGSIIDAFSTIVSGVVDVVVDVVNITINAPLAIAEITTFGLMIPGSNVIADDGSCRLQNLGSSFFETYSGECDSGFRFALAVSSTDVGENCRFQIPMTFYIPRMNVSYYQPYQWQFGSWENPVGYLPEGGLANLYSDAGCSVPVVIESTESGYAPFSTYCCVSATKQPFGTPIPNPSFNETGRQVAIYRFMLPADSSQAALNDWFVNQIPAGAGNGWQYDQPYGAYTLDQVYHQASDSGALVTLPYSEFCSGNVCQFTDATVPGNSYVAYAAKILGTYSYYYATGTGENEQYIIQSNENKFLNRDNASSAALPYSTSLGNALIGPYKTGIPDCPPPDTTCTSPLVWNGSACVPGVCDNGANNYPDCNTCTEPLVWNGASCVPGVCTNGANNYPACNACSSPLVWNGTSCVGGTCSNGANNYPACNACSSPLVWSGSGCVSAVSVGLTQSANTSYSDGVTGQPFTLAWSSSGATSCSLNKIVNGTAQGVACYPAGSLNGSCSASPYVIGTHVFTFSCSGPGGTDSDTVSHSVTSCPNGMINPPACDTPAPCTNGANNPTACTTCTAPLVWNGSSCSAPPPATAALSASPTSVLPGARPILFWSSTNATSCTAGGPWGIPASPPGNLIGNGLTDPLYTDTTFTFQCTGPGGTSALQSVTVTVGSQICTNGANNYPACNACTAPSVWNGSSCTAGSCNNGATNPPTCDSFPTVAPTASLSAIPGTITSGQSATLTWNSSNATSCTGVGFTASGTSGSVSTGPLTQTSNYQITCSGPGGTSAPAFASVTVLSPDVTISANPPRVPTGAHSTITWSATQVTSCTVSGPGLSSTAVSGSRTVAISSQSTYTITCQTTGAPISRSVTVNVVPLFQEF